jgi:fructokinase
VFVVCGEALMDVFAAGETPSGMALVARVGGSPLNVAVGLARLPQPVAFFGALCARLPRRAPDAPTTLGLVGLDALGVPSYGFYGEGGADRQLGIDALALLPTDIHAVQLGSYATVVEPIASTLRALVGREHTRTPICYDPNIRLNVEPELARWRDMQQWMLPRTHLLKISEDDLSLLLPGVGLQQFADDALEKGVGPVVVTRGGDGAVAWTQSGSVSVPAVTLPVVDTVDAGDTFRAALLTWLAEHACLGIDALGSMPATQLREALQFAVAAAAITCSRRGADLPRRIELDH